MNIVFSDHAILQIKERKLSEQEIIKAIQKPQKIFKQSLSRYKIAKRLTKNKKQYLLIVVYDLTNIDFCEVVTAFTTSKIKKYL